MKVELLSRVMNSCEEDLVTGDLRTSFRIILK